MKKIKKLLTIGLSILFAFGALCISACQGMDDIIPEAYGEWEQNYLYRGNGKTKTTGEDYEKLVETVEIDGEPYNAIYCLDSKIEADDIYMLLVCQKGGEDLTVGGYTGGGWEWRLDVVHCLVVYNIKDKTQKLLTADQKIVREGTEYFYRPTEMEGIFDERILLRASVRETSKINGNSQWINMVEWYTLDLDGVLLNPSIEYGNEWEWVSDEYLVAEIYDMESGRRHLYYRMSDLSDPVFIYEVTSGTEWSYVEQNGVKGLLIREYYNKTTSNESKALGEIKFYNFATKTMSERVSIRKYARFYGDYNYVKTYEYKTVEYYKKWNEKDSRFVETDNALYRLVYDENGVHLEEFFDLTEGHSFSIYGVREDKILFYEAWYQDHRGCMYGGSEHSYCEWDLTAEKGTATDFDTIKVMEDEYSAIYEQEKGIVVGDYIYFLHEEQISGGLMGKSTLAYMLKRRNVKTGDLEVMQVWHEEDNDSEDNRKFCEEFWFIGIENAYNFYEFTVRSY